MIFRFPARKIYIKFWLLNEMLKNLLTVGSKEKLSALV